MANPSYVSKNPVSRDALLLTVITVVGVLLRLPTLEMGLWLDEFISIFIATRPTLLSMYEYLWRTMDGNPPLNHLLMRAYIDCVGVDEITIRLPSLLWGILLIPAMYWLGKSVNSRSAGLLAACFAAFSPQANYFSLQTRAYSLSALLNVLCMICFCELLQPECKHKKRVLALFILLMTLLCYSSTFGIFCLAALVVAYAVLWLLQRYCGKDSPKSKLDLSLANFAPALFIPALLFAPWLPTMAHQAQIAKPVEACKLVELPWAFGVCLTTMLPLPLLASLGVAIAAGVLMPVVIIAQAFKGHLKRQILNLRDVALTTPGYVVLAAMTFAPSAVMGIFAGVWLGYFRYIYPFSSAEWMLLAMLFAGGNNITFKGKKFWRAALFVLFCCVNLAYLWWFDQKSQSGLKLVAQAIRTGRFDNSVILLAPDLPGPTLYFYSKKEERLAHHVVIKGFVREHPDTPTIGDVMPMQWSSTTAVDECLDKVEKWSQDGYKYLAFAQDSVIYGNAKIPLKDQVYSLFNRLKSKYKISKTETYPGVTETMNVSFFELK